MYTNINVVKGDTLSFGIEIEGLTQDLDTAYFSCKRTLDADEFVFQKSLGDGITKDSDGKYLVRIAPEDTAELDTGEYYYDVQIGLNGDIFTVLRGIFDILYDVTTN